MIAAISVLIGLAVLLGVGRRSVPRDDGDSGDEPVVQADPVPGAAPTCLREVAECAELLATALAGGAALIESLEVVGSTVGGGAGEHLRVVAAAVRWGVPVDEAWGLVPNAWQPVASAFVVAGRAGVAPSGLLAEAGASLRRAQASRAAVRAAELGARVALPLGMTLLPGFVLTTILPVLVALAQTLAR